MIRIFILVITIIAILCGVTLTNWQREKPKARSFVFSNDRSYLNNPNSVCYKLNNTHVLYLTPPNQHLTINKYNQRTNKAEYDAAVDEVGPPNLWIYDLCTQKKTQVTSNTDRSGIIDLLSWSSSKQYALIQTLDDYALVHITDGSFKMLELPEKIIDKYTWINDTLLEISYIAKSDRFTQQNTRTRYVETIESETMARSTRTYIDTPAHSEPGMIHGKWEALIDEFGGTFVYHREEPKSDGTLRDYFSIQTQTDEEIIVYESTYDPKDTRCQYNEYLGHTEDKLYFATCDTEKSTEIRYLSSVPSLGDKPIELIYQYDMTKQSLSIAQDLKQLQNDSEPIYLQFLPNPRDNSIYFYAIPDTSRLTGLIDINQPLLYKFDKQNGQLSSVYQNHSILRDSSFKTLSEDGLLHVNKGENEIFINIHNDISQSFYRKLNDHFSIKQVILEGNYH